MTKDKWVLVRDNDELRVGMTVRVDRSATGLLRGATILLRPTAVSCPYCGDIGWHVTGYDKMVCVTGYINNRVLFRLDTGETDEEQQAHGRKVYYGDENVMSVMITLDLSRDA